MIKVAIADDNENMVRMLTDLVSRDNELHVVGTARNGEEACEVIREKEPDIVLLDIVMPKLDGLGVMDRMNKDKNMKKHPDFIINQRDWAGECDGRRVPAGGVLLYHEAL